MGNVIGFEQISFLETAKSLGYDLMGIVCFFEYAEAGLIEAMEINKNGN